VERSFAVGDAPELVLSNIAGNVEVVGWDRQQVWVLAVVERGMVVYGQVFRKRPHAIRGLAEYLRANEGYDGPATMPSLGAWLAEHDDRLGADIFPASVDWS